MDYLVFKVGGSILSKSEENIFNVDYASKLKEVLKNYLGDDKKAILISGGGFLAKKYQAIGRTINSTDRDLDWIGTYCNNMNAIMLKTIFDEMTEDNALVGDGIKSSDNITFEKPVLCAGGAEPGHSSDTDALILAKRSGAKVVYSLKNVDGVYTADPRIDPSAKRIDSLTWDEYMSIIGTTEWKPKSSFPVDPIAAQLAKDNNIKVVVVNGEDLDNLNKVLTGQEFIGTIIG